MDFKNISYWDDLSKDLIDLQIWFSQKLGRDRQFGPALFVHVITFQFSRHFINFNLKGINFENWYFKLKIEVIPLKSKLKNTKKIKKSQSYYTRKLIQPKLTISLCEAVSSKTSWLTMMTFKKFIYFYNLYQSSSYPKHW